MSAAITFDFHNTLVRCDRWFDLEVRSLPTVVADRLSVNLPASASVELTKAYRDLRLEIIGHGQEMDAANGVLEALRRAGIACNAESVVSMVDALMTEVVTEATLLPGVHSTLAYLHARNVCLGVVSSAVHHRFLEWSLARLGVMHYFQAVVSSASAGFYKSRREIYDYALAELGASPERSVHVGDSYKFDHIAGQEVGLATVWLSQPNAARSCEGPKPDLELDTLEGAGPGLLELLFSRAGAIDED